MLWRRPITRLAVGQKLRECDLFPVVIMCNPCSIDVRLRKAVIMLYRRAAQFSDNEPLNSRSVKRGFGRAGKRKKATLLRQAYFSPLWFPANTEPIRAYAGHLLDEKKYLTLNAVSDGIRIGLGSVLDRHKTTDVYLRPPHKFWTYHSFCQTYCTN